jgi:bis(5'-nucleosyl)-tetraphosphatase (symmetrical)
MHYVIGDVQGCYDELRRLLDKLSFDFSRDRITFAGDLVNRGPKSTAVLKFVIENQSCMDTVLGNHDLHFLSLYSGLRKPGPKDTLSELLNHKNVDTIANWLLGRQLCIEIEKTFLVCHAGLYPLWTPKKALAHSKSVSKILQSTNWGTFLKSMYGNTPNTWNPKDKKTDRLRFIINAFTRMRYLDRGGQLNFRSKGPIETTPSETLIPWFNHSFTKNNSHTVLFGHWSAIGAAKRSMSVSLDGGCVWGGELCAINTTTLDIIRVSSRSA